LKNTKKKFNATTIIVQDKKQAMMLQGEDCSATFGLDKTRAAESPKKVEVKHLMLPEIDGDFYADASHSQEAGYAAMTGLLVKESVFNDVKKNSNQLQIDLVAKSEDEEMKLYAMFVGAFILLAPVFAQNGLLPNGSADLGVMYWTGVTPVFSDFFTGKYCFEAQVKSNGSKVKPWHAIKVVPGEKYTFSAWVRAPQEPCEVGIMLQIPDSSESNRVLLKNTQIGSTWTRISGIYTAEPGIRLVKLSLPCRSASGKGTLLLDDISLNAPVTTLQMCKVDHHVNLEEDARQGHELDEAYQLAGQRIDVILFDFDEMKLQGKAVPPELYREVESAGQELRQEWWKICTAREAFWRNYTRAKVQNVSLTNFREKITDYSRKAGAVAQHLEEATAALRKDLVYSRKPLAKDFWKDRFVLAADIEWVHWGVDRLAYPGRVFNAEYEAKAANDLKLDIVTLLMHPLGDEQRCQFTNAFDHYSKAPFLVWSTDNSFIKNDMVNEQYFTNREKLEADIDQFLAKYRSHEAFFGVQVDEPWILDNRIKKLLDAEWEQYLESRRDYLQANHVTDPRNTIEWKLFKSEFLGRHLQHIFAMLSKKQVMTSICIMPKYEDGDPASSSYVNSCRYLPLAGTDLYRNGSTIEGFHLQLFKNTMQKGRAWLLPGSMFSCKTPESYKRSISNGIVHADGIHMWTSTYFSKYRDANNYWRYGASRPTLDDRKRNDMYNWYPWGWKVMRERYRYVAEHADVLAKRESLADVALLVSERTRFLCRGKSYWNSCLAFYNELVGMNAPFDAIFLENMTEDHYQRYRVLIAPNMTALTPAEIARLQKYVENGGTLLTTEDFASADEWGRPNTNVPKFGLRFSSVRINTGVQENNLSFTRRLTGDALALFRSTVQAKSRMPFKVVGLPFGVEVQIQKNAQGKTIIQLLDYVGRKLVQGHRLLNTKTGEETPLPAFNIHDMIIL